MTLPIHRRDFAGLLASCVVPAQVPAQFSHAKRGQRLPSHADFWSRLPLPFTLAQAWGRLTPSTQAEIGAAVLGMALAEYIAGDALGEDDKFLDAALRSHADDVQHDLLNAMPDRLWRLFPELYGPDGDHPRWALDGGLAR